jgi:hypothetical protein
MATEEPAYRVSLGEGAIEVREYPALVVAEVAVSGDRQDAANAGFRLLAGYIFGGNTRRQGIPMTAPVLQAQPSGVSIPMTAPVTQSGVGNQWVVRFVMPVAYKLEMLPVPNDSKVRLFEMPPSRYAVVRFSGLAGEKDIGEKTAELQRFIHARGLRATGPAELARYDPPWTLWFMRRNEVRFPLAPD